VTTELVEYRCDEAEARALTDAIKEGVEKTYRRLLQAHRWRAWSALGYASWRDYAQTEFGIGQSRAYQLLDQARVVEEIEQAVSTSVELTEAQVRDLKPHLPAVIEAVREATADVPDDEKPAAAAEAIRQARAHVTTTTRTTEATKVEHDVDLDTGEILDDFADLDTDEETFEAALSVARSEGDLSRENVVAHIRSDRTQPRRPLVDVARDAGQELRKAVERLERLAADDRFARNKNEVAAHLRHHLAHAIKVCQDLDHSIN
jgi:hypothetical protein